MINATVWHVCGTPRKNSRAHRAIEHRKMSLTSKGNWERVTGIEPA